MKEKVKSRFLFVYYSYRHLTNRKSHPIGVSKCYKLYDNNYSYTIYTIILKM